MAEKKMEILSSRDLDQVFNTGWDSKWNALFNGLFELFGSGPPKPLSSHDIKRIMEFITDEENLFELEKNDPDHNSENMGPVKYRFHHSFYSLDDEDHVFVFEKEMQYKE